jgi:hypothetical protein
MSAIRDEFLKKLDSGWNPPSITKQEYLRRIRLQIEGIINHILDSDPGAEREMVSAMKRAASIDELKPMIDRLAVSAEKRFPGIVEMVEKLVEKERRLAEELQ